MIRETFLFTSRLFEKCFFSLEYQHSGVSVKVKKITNLMEWKVLLLHLGYPVLFSQLFGRLFRLKLCSQISYRFNLIIVHFDQVSQDILLICLKLLNWVVELRLCYNIVGFLEMTKRFISRLNWSQMTNFYSLFWRFILFCNLFWLLHFL